MIRLHPFSFSVFAFFAFFVHLRKQSGCIFQITVVFLGAHTKYFKVNMVLHEASCPSMKAAPGIKLRAEYALSAAPIRNQNKTKRNKTNDIRRNSCMLSGVSGMLSISVTISVLWLWVCWDRATTGVGTHYPSHTVDQTYGATCVFDCC